MNVALTGSDVSFDAQCIVYELCRTCRRFVIRLSWFDDELEDVNCSMENESTFFDEINCELMWQF